MLLKTKEMHFFLTDSSIILLGLSPWDRSSMNNLQTCQIFMWEKSASSFNLISYKYENTLIV